MSDTTLNILVVGKDDGATELIKQITASLKDVGDQSEKTRPKSEGLFSKLTVTAGDAIQAVQAVAGAARGLYDGMVGGNAEFEQYNVRFATLLHSASAAKDRMAELAEFGQKTPFELPDVVKADTVLQGFGLHSEEAAKKFGFAGRDIRTIAGDVASGTGADFKEMALLIGKFSAGATGEAISRMQELGITSRDELRQLGLSFSKAGELTSPLPQAMNTVLTLMKQKYGGLMDAQSATFDGMLSNLADWKGATLREVGEPIFEALKPQLASLLAFLGSGATKQAIHDFAAGIGQAIQVVGQIGQAIHDYGIPALSGLSAALTLYAVTSIPAAISATSAFLVALAPVALAAAPFVVLGAAVAGVVLVTQELKQANESATDQLLQSRPWWNQSTQALDDYGTASDATKQRLSGLAGAVEANRAELEREIQSLARRREAGQVNDAQFQREMDIINQHRVAVTKSSEALAEQLRIAGETDTYDAHEEALHQIVSAQGTLRDAVQLTDQELKDLEKTFERVNKEGPQALAQVAQSQSTFFGTMESSERGHAAKLADIQRDGADRRVGMQRDYNDKIASLIHDATDRLDVIQQNYSDKVTGLAQDQNDRLIGMQRDYNDKVAGLTQDLAERRTSMTRDYNDRIAEMESDKAERRARLERDYNDRIAELTASGKQDQIDQVTQKYQRELSDLDQQTASQQAKLKAHYERDQADLEAANAKKKAELDAQHQREQADLEAANAKKKAELDAQHQREIVAFQTANTKKKAELDAAHQKEQADLELANAKKLEAEQQAFAEQQQAAALAYAQQEAAQRAHLGQELIDYVQAMAIKDSTFRDRADTLTGEIAKQYGVQQSVSSLAFGSMLNDIDRWKTEGGASAQEFAGHLAGVTDKAAALQRQIDEQTTRSVQALDQQFRDKKISIEEYSKALASVPATVTTTVQLNAQIAQILAGDDGALGRALVNQLPGRAGGGDVLAGRPYVVGERQPELFVPRSSGTIVPSLGGAGGTTISVGQIVVQGVQNPQENARLIREELLRLKQRNLNIGLS